MAAVKNVVKAITTATTVIVAVIEFAPKAMDLGAKIADAHAENQKNLVKIPNLKDVHIDKALQILKDAYDLVPTQIIARPKLTYADDNVNEVVYSEPRFGSRVNPRTAVKVYYLTQEVIDKSKVLKDKKEEEKQKRIDKVVKVAPNIAKKIGKLLTKKVASSES